MDETLRRARGFAFGVSAWSERAGGRVQSSIHRSASLICASVSPAVVEIRQSGSRHPVQKARVASRPVSLW